MRLHRVKRLSAVLLTVLLGACASGTGIPPAPPPPEPNAEPVGDVTLQVVPAASEPLDIAIAVFDQGLNNRDDGEAVFPTVRKAESLLIPVSLSSRVEASGAWGAVRVVHSPEVRLPLMVEGEILRADGAVLELRVRLRAVDGELLLERNYRDEARPADYPVAQSGEPFADVYRAISNDLLEVLATLPPERRETLRRLALMRFAAELSPTSFGRFIAESEDGRVELLSFPATGDPMLARLSRLRRQDELFVDAVDEQYSDLRDRVAESYALWREYNFELQRFGDEYRSRAGERKSSARRGSYAAMQQVYAGFRKVKIQEEDVQQLVKGFAGESLETVLEVDDSVFRLSGNVDERYAEWRRILSRINTLETGEL